MLVTTTNVTDRRDARMSILRQQSLLDIHGIIQNGAPIVLTINLEPIWFCGFLSNNVDKEY